MADDRNGGEDGSAAMPADVSGNGTADSDTADSDTATQEMVAFDASAATEALPPQTRAETRKVAHEVAQDLTDAAKKIESLPKPANLPQTIRATMAKSDPAVAIVGQLEKVNPATLNPVGRGIYHEIMGSDYKPRDESLERGKALRKQLPRSAQGEWTVQPGRADGVDIILSQEKDRLADLLPVRHERMAASAFAFYRAAAAVMTHDLSSLPRTGITVQTCGDAHISNFGMFQSPERELVFDINDFDETLPGPWEWDVKRMLTSIEICGRDRGFTDAQREKAVLAAAHAYCDSMRDFSDMSTLDVWYAHLRMESIYNSNKTTLGEQDAQAIRRAIDKALTKNNDKAVSKLTEIANGHIQIVSNPPLVVPVREMESNNKNAGLLWFKRARLEYRMSLPRERRSLIDQYEVCDIARKVVGVGSVGTRDWIVVLQGREGGDYLVLQVKEAGESALEPYVGESTFLEHGRRVVEGQRAIQTAGDILLGWSRLADEKGRPRDYYVRQLWDGKGSIDLATVTPDGLTGVGCMCAWVLAHAHAKTGDRHAITGYLGKGDAFSQAMLAFARAYADQNQADYETFLARMESA